MTENLIIFNARVVTPIGFSARCGREMEEICIMDDATVEVTGGVITYDTDRARGVSHGDLAWASMTALYNEPIGSESGGGSDSFVEEF